MGFKVQQTSGVPTASIPAVVAALKVDPNYAAHLTVDESTSTTFLVVVYRDSPVVRARGASSRGAAPKASRKKTATRGKRTG